MNQMQTKNPQMFQMINQAKNSGANPQEFMKQIMKNATPQDMQQTFQMAKQFGVPNEVLQQIQNSIK